MDTSNTRPAFVTQAECVYIKYSDNYKKLKRYAYFAIAYACRLCSITNGVGDEIKSAIYIVVVLYNNMTVDQTHSGVQRQTMENQPFGVIV